MFSFRPASSTASEAALSQDVAGRGWAYARSGWSTVPAWAMSLALHCTVFVALGLLIRVDPPAGNESAEPDRAAGIVLVERSQGEVKYFSEDEAEAAAAAIAAPSASALPAAAEMPQLDGPQLPSASSPLASSAPPSSIALPGATGMAEGSTPQGFGRGHDYDVETGVFGVKGRGSKFVYVFDRSASMSGFEGRPLRSAKRELVASIQSLGKLHQFQVIFYNQKPLPMTFSPAEQPMLVFGSDDGKRLAEEFIRGVTADGGTRHLEALKMALQMRPDVIFFLTDADEPRLTHRELQQIRHLNRGATINAVEYGAGPSLGERTFLQQLAEENGGQHRYVDVTELPRE